MFGYTCCYCGGLLESEESVDGDEIKRMYRCPFCMREERYIIANMRFSLI
jgi:hypothetical protein